MLLSEPAPAVAESHVLVHLILVNLKYLKIIIKMNTVSVKVQAQCNLYPFFLTTLPQERADEMSNEDHSDLMLVLLF